ncbi:MAG: UDP-N-acetylmuramoyl-tripeptide--D-alanyl-D-alanine ligase [Chloroflexi bacterium]|nr:UDP-N-acetylmuramoyl-tripeptide--D-alanyl-D-alanine ligase [Chloroflexota bacterium]
MPEFPTTEVLQGLGRRLRHFSPPPPSIRRFDGVAIDSRAVMPGDLFIALKGNQDNGHNYMDDALKRGAAGIILQDEERMTRVSSSPCAFFLVDDTLMALQSLAAYWRSRHTVEVIGITGSVGKTSTKELVASVQAQKFKVLKNEGNLNSEIGLPLTLLRLDSSYQRVVLEMAMYGPGEIQRLCDIAQPRIGIVTNISHSHLERLGSLQAIALAKGELVNSLPEDGIAVLNGDDELVRRLGLLTKARSFLYGLGEDSNLWADEIESKGLDGIQFRVHHKGESLYLRVPLLGRHSVHTSLAAIVVGLVEGLSWEEISNGLQDPSAQLRLLVTPGVRGSTIIDDTYNANPVSTLAALNLLADLEGRKIAVLGDMLELGPYEIEGHRQVGRRVADVAEKLIVLGEKAKIIGLEAQGHGMKNVVFTTSHEDVVARLLDTLQEGDCVLVKGSRGMRMERIVEGIKFE